MHNDTMTYMRHNQSRKVHSKEPVELTVEQFIEAFRQKFGAQFVGKPATRLVEALQQSMNVGEAEGHIRITNRDQFLTH